MPEEPRIEPGRVDEIGTVVSRSSGPINSGPGDQHNTEYRFMIGEIHHHNDYRQDEARRRKANPQAIPDDYIRLLQDRFVRPDSLQRAEQMLASPAATVLIGGPVGSGRQTAAQMLLCPPRSQHRSLRWLPAEPEADGEVLDPSQVADDDRLLLDLSEVDRDLFGRHRQQLPAFRAAVQDKAARLVVVLSHDQQDFLPAELRSLLVRISAPDSQQVLMKHLPQEMRSACAQVLRTADLNRLLPDASMDTVARFAGLIVEASRGRGAAPDFSQWFQDALTVLTNHANAVTEVMHAHTDGPTRALLLSAAMLEGASVDAVYHGEQALLLRVEHPPADTPGLERRDLYVRVGELDADVDHERRVRFRKFAYGAAVLTHFWDRYPHLHTHLSLWTKEFVERWELSDEDRSRIAERFTGQCLRTGRVSDVLDTAKMWARSRRFRIRSLAYSALASAVIHDRVGGAARQRLYEWAGNPQLHSELARIIIAVCLDALGPTYPDRSLVRLRLLGRHSDPAIAAEARQALVELAADDRFFRGALAKITETTGLDAELFFALADPQRLADLGTLSRPLIFEASVRAQLVTGWRSIMVSDRHQLWAEPVRRWLQAYAGDPRRGALLDVLIEACDGRADLFARLFEIKHAWLAGPAEPTERGRRHRTSRDVDDKIDRARGLDALYSGLVTTAEEMTS